MRFTKLFIKIMVKSEPKGNKERIRKQYTKTNLKEMGTRMKIANKMLIVLQMCAFIMFIFFYGVKENKSFAETETGINVGQKAPAFKLSTINGKDLDLESFRKDKTVLLVFGATWCRYCRLEAPYLNEYYSELKDKNLEVLNIDIGESEKKVSSYVKENEIKYHVVLDSDGQVSDSYRVTGIPLNIILDKEGIIRYRENVLPDKNDLKKYLAN